MIALGLFHIHLRVCSNIKRRIAQTATAFMAKRPLLCSKSIRLDTRKQHVKTFVWAVAFYGSEAWAIGKTDQERIEGFERSRRTL
jgi:hypothetical protein